jgi:hypothetical protein
MVFIDIIVRQKISLQYIFYTREKARKSIQPATSDASMRPLPMHIPNKTRAAFPSFDAPDAETALTVAFIRLIANAGRQWRLADSTVSYGSAI